MTDRPMIFSAPMIRALLAGQKTQTRRIIKPQPSRPECWAGTWVDANRERHARHDDGERSIVRYEIGDRLWVRETFEVEPTGCGGVRFIYVDHAERLLLFDEGDPRIDHADRLWTEPDQKRPSIQMPRWASRLTLNVTDVRVQRLQDISEEDAKAEGVKSCVSGHDEEGPIRAFRTGFVGIWREIHGDAAWAENPWVAALSFTVRHSNIDARTPS